MHDRKSCTSQERDPEVDIRFQPTMPDERIGSISTVLLINRETAPTNRLSGGTPIDSSGSRCLGGRLETSNPALTSDPGRVTLKSSHTFKLKNLHLLMITLATIVCLVVGDLPNAEEVLANYHRVRVSGTRRRLPATGPPSTPPAHDTTAPGQVVPFSKFDNGFLRSNEMMFQQFQKYWQQQNREQDQEITPYSPETWGQTSGTNDNNIQADPISVAYFKTAAVQQQALEDFLKVVVKEKEKGVLQATQMEQELILQIQQDKVKHQDSLMEVKLKHQDILGASNASHTAIVQDLTQQKDTAVRKENALVDLRPITVAMNTIGSDGNGKWTTFRWTLNDRGQFQVSVPAIQYNISQEKSKMSIVNAKIVRVQDAASRYYDFPGMGENNTVTLPDDYIVTLDERVGTVRGHPKPSKTLMFASTRLADAINGVPLTTDATVDTVNKGVPDRCWNMAPLSKQDYQTWRYWQRLSRLLKKHHADEAYRKIQAKDVVDFERQAGTGCGRAGGGAASDHRSNHDADS